MPAKDDFIKNFQTKLQEWDTKMNKVIARSEAAQKNAEAEYYDYIQDMKTKRSQVEDRLEKVKEAGGDAWKDMVQGAENALSELQDAANRAIRKFEEPQQ